MKRGPPVRIPFPPGKNRVPAESSSRRAHHQRPVSPCDHPRILHTAEETPGAAGPRPNQSRAQHNLFCGGIPLSRPNRCCLNSPPAPASADTKGGCKPFPYTTDLEAVVVTVATPPTSVNHKLDVFDTNLQLGTSSICLA